MRRHIVALLTVAGVFATGAGRSPRAQAPRQKITAVPETLTDDELMWRARQFHGHLGPWLTLGIVMGQYAVDRLGGQKYTRLHARIEVEAIAPRVSILDGIQFSSGCTLGNRNLVVERPSRSRAPIRVTFVGSRGQGDTLTLEVQPSIPRQFDRWVRSGEDEKALFKRVAHMPVEQLFRVVE
ncbi:MAG: FmdE family protein [Armatimonadota bacterium]